MFHFVKRHIFRYCLTIKQADLTNLNYFVTSKVVSNLEKGANLQAVTIDGDEHTISNINLNNLVYNVQGIGFIGSAADLTVSNLTLDNVQFTKTYDTRNSSNISKSFMVKAVGGLCGTASGAISLSNVTVNLADNFGYSSYSVHNNVAVEVDATKVGIGGLIGIAGGDADDRHHLSTFTSGAQALAPAPQINYKSNCNYEEHEMIKSLQ